MQQSVIPSAYTVTDDANLTDMVWNHANTHPDDPFIARDALDPASMLTTTEFRNTVAAVAKGLIASGINPGDRVALMSRTRFEWALFDYAIWAVGAITVPVYETSSAEQAQWILSDSGAVAAIVELPRHAVTIAQIRETLPALRTVWQIDADPSAETVLVAAGTKISDEQLTARRTAVQADDLATIIYTSGTTGHPKGCELAHRNLLSGAGNALAIYADEFNSTGRIVMFLPMAHVLARDVTICAIMARSRVAFCADPQDLLKTAAAFKPTLMLAVPRVLDKVYNGAKQKAYSAGKERIFAAAERTAIAYSTALDSGGPGVGLRIKHAAFDALVYRKIRAVLGGQCRTVISGGAALAQHIAHFFRGVGLHVFEGWGLTETTAAATVNHPHKTVIGTVGPPIPGTTIAISDDSEILVKGEIVFRGYWGNEQATREAFDADGWLHTGDMGALDDGCLRITGRKKEILVTAGGKNVAPGPLEERLSIHPLVAQSMVIGDAQPFIACLITVDPDMLEFWKQEHHKIPDATLDQLREDPDLIAALQSAVDHANASVSRAEQIKVFRIISTDFTVENGLLTPSLKVKRDKVAAAFADEIATIYDRG